MTIPATSPALVSYRVELRHLSGTTRLLGLVTGVARHHSTLDPYVSRLLPIGITGAVLLVEAETGLVVARRQVTRPKARRYSANPAGTRQ